MRYVTFVGLNAAAGACAMVFILSVWWVIHEAKGKQILFGLGLATIAATLFYVSGEYAYRVIHNLSF